MVAPRNETDAEFVDFHFTGLERAEELTEEEKILRELEEEAKEIARRRDWLVGDINQTLVWFGEPKSLRELDGQRRES